MTGEDDEETVQRLYQNATERLEGNVSTTTDVFERKKRRSRTRPI